MAKRIDKDKYDDAPTFIFLGRIERHETTGSVSIHLIQDFERVEIQEGAEYVSVGLKINPFENTGEEGGAGG